MKHNFSDQELTLAWVEPALDAGESYPTADVGYIRAFLDALPEPASDDWEACAFDEIQKGDTIKYETPDALIEPKHPVFRNFGDELAFVGDMKVWNHPDAKWFRIPAPAQHPDPERTAIYGHGQEAIEVTSKLTPLLGQNRQKSTGHGPPRRWLKMTANHAHTPTTPEYVKDPAHFRAVYVDHMDSGKYDGPTPNMSERTRGAYALQFDRMIQAVEAAAEQRGAARGWDEAMTAQIQRLISGDPDVERFQMPANPYRADRITAQEDGHE